MNRQLEPGDLAIIIIDNIQYSLPISSASSDRIIAGDYVLIPTVDGWHVQDYNIPHTVTFQAANREQLLSGVEDVDRLILLDLDYRSLLKACSTDQYTNKICQDDFFWRQKVERDMGQEVLINKLPGMSYREQYRTLVSGMDEKMAIINGRLDYLIWKNVSPNEFAAMTAAELGWINILEWVKNHGILLDSGIANGAAMTGKIDVLKWLHERNIHPDDTGFLWALERHEKDTIEWLLNYGVIPHHPEIIIEEAIFGDDVDVLELLAAHGILPGTRGANLAAVDGNINILEWLYKRDILPDEEGFIGSVEYGEKDVVGWLLDHGIIPQNLSIAANRAIHTRNIDMLEFLETRGILPNEEGVRFAKRIRIRPILEWLASRGLFCPEAPK
jgi:hypothetical protein